MFTTKVYIPKSSTTISYQSKGLLLGSCFAQEMGMIMAGVKLPVTTNPHGTLFNPASIGRAFDDMMQGVQYSATDLVEYQGLWHSMQHHGSFSDTSQKSVLERINGVETPTFDYAIVTLGTAWVYEYRGEVVANCHRLPASAFDRRRLSVDECVDSLINIAATGKHIILTVSPIRHVKDGLAENMLSKSILRVAAAELAAMYDNVNYFPSFEILIDELRDYRYYAPDMLHPSTVAVEYIWERFCESFFDDRSRKLMMEIGKLKSAFSHRPLHRNTAEYQQFKIRTVEHARKLTALYPELDFSNELSSWL